MTNNKYKILVIEDEANIRGLLTAMLESGGFHVIQCDTCDSAILLYESYHPDLALLDLGLPDADGMRFLRYVRRNALTPVVVVSARTDESDKIAALDLGANDYVTKPFSPAELTARVDALFRRTGGVEEAPRAGEELWQVAKRIRCAPEELKKSNPDLTFPLRGGERLYVYRRIK